MTARMDFSAAAQDRSQAYWLLSRLFLQVPDVAHLRELQAWLASAGGQGPLEELAHAVDDALDAPEAAAVEFTRRLVAIDKNSGDSLPYESFVREGTVPGDVTAQVAYWMDDAGFADVAPDAPSPDHIGAELRFMALLCFEESQAWAEGMQEEAGQLLARQSHFLHHHLGAWAPEYCQALEARAEHGYMKALARLTRECLLEDSAAVGAKFAAPNAA